MFKVKSILEYALDPPNPADLITQLKSKPFLVNSGSSFLSIFTFNDLTRFFAWIIEQPYNIVLAIFSKGILKGQGQDAIQIMEPLSWISVVGIFFTLALYTRDKFLIILVVLSIVYL